MQLTGHEEIKRCLAGV